ncbi:esterase family protein [Mucilaginibacter sp. L3T2-6]|uniref:alpha/beta hydrolase n=1 Tax=Mucilaginibacter sp. L3T2-6 TaxID=3062491 RepID=UPI0026755ABB|nr:alpha/beta hydrolase-fold protein [Mucilaginibacter sp. L3T2-6]MDO3640759.1 alpha/beta hydrolase-fold protein [Mucilaginibacter sp. L3T2-6]MDV6212900.1 alpha/beta hydrolase-fold protein [Mucilaginibacter sp. L3T2-6]
MYASWQEMEIAITETNITLKSDVLKRDVVCTLLMPDDNDITEPLNLLLLNDGQELEAIHLKDTLAELNNYGRIRPVVVVAVHAGEERLQEYGTAGKPDFKKRGAKAGLYTGFIKQELLPGITKLTGIEKFNSTVYAGFSLGGLSALDIAWNNPGLFNKVGVFSGSFWWRSKDLAKGYTDGDRIMHDIVKNTPVKPDIKIWLQTGTKDETSDRNKNGIIDSIDDTIDLIKELEGKGFTRPEDIQYMEMVGGGHNTETWAKAMPKFLAWAFGR